MNIAVVIQIIVGIVTIITAVYKIAEAKNHFYNYVQNEAKSLNSKIDSLNRELAVFISAYNERKEHVDYRFHGLEEKVEHKFNRLHGDLKEVEGYIQKHGFIIRDKEY
ncbi:MAG: hypothetical protein C6Y22_22180 [Hapalosiphonaceae cyanobacterium JJU2]|nr:MAG: hypothetical protein C6Y22_22180 [Hapalosiphonaceae cyanobacterium JJU2]